VSEVLGLLKATSPTAGLALLGPGSIATTFFRDNNANIIVIRRVQGVG
jgi:hypothetical protein